MAYHANTCVTWLLHYIHNSISADFLFYLQILRLLDVLGMRKYQEEFARESIDGMILAECDELVLQHELGVSSKQDQMKLMRIISGHQSALSILEGSVYIDSDS